MATSALPWFVQTAPPPNETWYPGRTIGSATEGTRIADTTPLDARAEANAALIVRAVNAHDVLIVALNHLAACVAEMAGRGVDLSPEVEQALDEAGSALAQAGVP